MPPNMTDYAAERAGFAWSPPERFNFARDVLDRHAETRPDALAILWVDDHGNEQRRSFGELADRSRRLAGALSDAGVSQGDTVVAVLGRDLEWWELLTACLRLGAVFSPGTTQLAPRDIAYRLEAARATCLVTDAAGADKADAIADAHPTLATRVLVGGTRDGWLAYDALLASGEPDFPCADTAFDEPALCFFTSGTTGYPKLTLQSQGYGLAHQLTGRYWLDLQPDDLHWNLSDTGWAKAAWSSYFGPWNVGAALFVHQSPTFDPVQTLELLARYPITTFCGAPTVYRMLVLQDLAAYRFSTLRHCVGAGEPLNPEVIETWRAATGLVIRDGYGQTESVLLCGNYPCLEPRLGSMGKPPPGIDLAIVDEAGNPLPIDTEGDIAVRVKPERAPGLFLEYRDAPEKTAACFVGDWYVTGDRGTVDADGYFWFVSRADDVIVSAGYRIGPFEVESALLEHPAVAESAVVASPDATRGAVVKAFVVPTPGTEPDDALARELQEHVKRVTAPYKYPRRIEFVDALPKTVSGKIRRVELRAREAGE